MKKLIEILGSTALLGAAVGAVVKNWAWLVDLIPR